jgi:hypothetical protein
MFIEKWILLAATALFVVVFVLMVRRGKQVRALRFCFLHFSDAVKNEIDDCMLEQSSGDTASGAMKGLARVWGGELDWSRRVMARAGLSWFSGDDKFYVLED